MCMKHKPTLEEQKAIARDNIRNEIKTDEITIRASLDKLKEIEKKLVNGETSKKIEKAHEEQTKIVKTIMARLEKNRAILKTLKSA